MNTFKQLLKQPTTKAGIIIALVFQIVFFCVWLTAYDGVQERITELDVALVNEDTEAGMMIADQIEQNLPLTIDTTLTEAEAEEALQERTIQMIVHIPNDFTEKLSSDEKAEITYSINQASATVGKQALEQIATKLTTTINEQVAAQQLAMGGEQFVSQLSDSGLPEQAVTTIQEQLSATLDQVDLAPITADINRVNETEGFAATMIPMMLVLASFVGSMTMNMQIQVSVMGLARKGLNKWSVFWSRQLLNVLVSAGLAFLTYGLIAIFDISVTLPFWTVWFYQFLVFLSFLLVSQTFLILLGPAGMMGNIVLLSMQLVTSGVIVPVAMLSPFYQTISSILPATYAADGYFTVIFGGTGVTQEFLPLLMIMAVVLIISVGRVALQKHPEHQKALIQPSK
ncbi:YhgE/Pip domain-containing protein [Alkalicoccobacillus plakortidis]|uniref:ABC transporter permease n=1 Tax=Alkalicoccobacillus plakortidis TaxID=444060 RepID=A0ABT0XM31_9BACI|nr:ABC transporter permease [Alkalicoccobacillus plakortidis]MCM2676882.1 ABC transporter permease [Alkalicoccobacillus plakortidis]